MFSSRTGFKSFIITGFKPQQTWEPHRELQEHGLIHEYNISLLIIGGKTDHSERVWTLVKLWMNLSGLFMQMFQQKTKNRERNSKIKLRVSLHSSHTLPKTKHTLTVCCYVCFMAHCFALCLCWSITAAVRSRVSRGRAGRRLGRCTCIPPYRHHPCSSRPSYKSPLMTRRRWGGRRDSRQGGRDGGRGRLKSAAV